MGTAKRYVPNTSQITLPGPPNFSVSKHFSNSLLLFSTDKELKQQPAIQIRQEETVTFYPGCREAEWISFVAVKEVSGYREM